MNDAAAQCVGVVVPTSGPPPHSAIENMSPFATEYLSLLPLFKSAGNKASYVLVDSQNDPSAAVNGVRQIVQQNKCVAVVTDRWVGSMLNSIALLTVAGTRNPYENLPPAFKQMSLQDPTKAAYVTVGWIPFNTPNLDVRNENGTYIIRIKDGHKGWSEYVFGVIAFDKDSSNISRQVDLSMDWVASPEANRIFGKWFYIVPDNSRLGRRVRIDLVKDDGKTIVASTSCGPEKCYPTPAVGRVEFQGTDGKTYTVCGSASACPQFMPRPEYRMIKK